MSPFAYATESCDVLAASSSANALAAGYTASRAGRIWWYRSLMYGDSGDTVAPVSRSELARDVPSSLGRRYDDVANRKAY